MRVLDDEQCGFGARHRCGVDQCGQPAPPGVRVDGGQRHIGIGDAQQIVEQQQVLVVGFREFASEANPCGTIVEVGDAGARAQQSRHHLKGDVAGMGLAEGPVHLDTATRREHCGLAGRATLADTRRSHDIHHTAAATDRVIDEGVERGHLPSPSDQARLGVPDQALPRADAQ